MKFRPKFKVGQFVKFLGSGDLARICEVSGWEEITGRLYRFYKIEYLHHLGDPLLQVWKQEEELSSISQVELALEVL